MKRTVKTIIAAAIMCLIGHSAYAQSITEMIQKATSTDFAKKIIETATGTTLPVDVKGTWTYSGTAVKFESDDLLKSTAASLAATKVEEKLDSYVAKVGIKAGTFSFTFKEDNTFAATVKGKSFNGTYTLSEDYKTISLQFGKSIALKPFTAAISATSSQIDLLFEADRLLELLGKLTSSSSNSTLNTIGSLVNQYDGLQLGLELKK